MTRITSRAGGGGGYRVVRRCAGGAMLPPLPSSVREGGGGAAISTASSRALRFPPVTRTVLHLLSQIIKIFLGQERALSSGLALIQPLVGHAARPTMRSTAESNQDDEEHLLTEHATRDAGRPTWLSCIREGNMDIIVPLVILCVCSAGVLVYNIVRQQYEPCDTTRPFAKHFYCYNASRSPGVHDDR